jgi:shikimate kinase
MRHSPPPTGHIALVGLSGAGKSSAGPLLAAALGLQFLDTDREIEREAGMPVGEIFARHGEPHFRQLEARQVHRALHGPPAVVSLGGGAVLDEASRRLIWDRATVVWLLATPEVLARRLAVSHGAEPRPLLAGGDPATRLRKLLQARSDFYSAAHLHVDTTHRTPAQVAVQILDALGDARCRGE